MEKVENDYLEFSLLRNFPCMFVFKVGLCHGTFQIGPIKKKIKKTEKDPKYSLM